MLEIITGHTGVDHVTSADDASLYRSIFGGQDAVLNVGSQFEHTIVSNNLIKIADGDLVIQGHQARIRTNDYEELVIDNGTPGMQRRDLIVARYEKDVVSGIESVNLAVVKGTPATNAVDPQLTQDDITSGGTVREFPLYRVRLNGITIETVDKLFKVRETIENLDIKLEGETAKKLFTGYTNGAVKYTIPRPGVFLVTAGGNANSPSYMLLVGKWGTGSPAYSTIIDPTPASISFSGDEITINHEGRWGYYSIVKLT